MEKIIDNGYRITGVRSCFKIDAENSMGGYTATVRRGASVNIRTKYDTTYSGILREFFKAIREGEQDSFAIENQEGKIVKVGIHDISYMEVL